MAKIGADGTSSSGSGLGDTWYSIALAITSRGTRLPVLHGSSFSTFQEKQGYACHLRSSGNSRKEIMAPVFSTGAIVYFFVRILIKAIPLRA